MSKIPTMTTTNGSPVGDNQNSLTAGPRGPLLAQDWQLFEKHAHFNRERIPERIVHAKGSGAYGKLTVTGDISHGNIRHICTDTVEYLPQTHVFSLTVHH